MKYASNIFKKMTIAIIGCIVGCATPIEVRQLADKTAANVGTISIHLQRLALNSRAISELRAANISHLHAVNTDLRSRYEYDVELTRKSGGSENLTFIPQIEAWKNKVQEIFEKAKGVQAERKRQILDGQIKLDTKSKALAEVAQSLATMAQEDKPADRVRFLIGYARDVNTELDVAIEADNKGAKAAKELIDAASSNFKPKPKSKTEVKDGTKN